MQKKLTIFGILLIGILITITVVSADNVEPFLAYVAQFRVFVNDGERNFEDPIITINGRTYVPLREMSEVLGMDVEWDEENQKIIIGSPESSHNGDAGMLYPFARNGLWGYIDDSGNTVVEPQYRVAREFFEGLAYVSGEPEQRGFIDLSGNLVIPLPTGRYIHDFSQGFTRVVFREWDWGNEYITVNGGPGGPYVYIDRTGENIFGMEFASAEKFNEHGLVQVTLLNGRATFIDTTGVLCEFDETGYARVRLLDGTRTHIDRQGNIVDRGGW
jgi:hypothetical protein